MTTGRGAAAILRHMSPHRSLLVSKRAHDLALIVARHPPLASPRHRAIEAQLRRAVIAVGVRISEAAALRQSRRRSHHWELALCAVREAAFLIRLLSDLGELSTTDHAKLEARVDEIARMLVGLLRARLRTSTGAARIDGGLPRGA
jgi:four helix bundle protein